MGASKYVGRVGGLAVALGTGFAILTGGAVASADSGESSEPSSSSASASSDSPASPDSRTDDDADGDAGSEVDAEDDDSDDDSEDDDSEDDGSEDGDTENDDTDSVDDEALAEESNEVDPVDTAADDGDRPLTDVSTDTALDAPHDLDAPVDTNHQDELSPATYSVGAQSFRTLSVESGPASAPAPEPEAPPAGLAAFTLLSAARPQLAALDPISYEVFVNDFDGVITGYNDAPDEAGGRQLVYTVLGKPARGGKVVITDEGDFSFLPHSSQMTEGGYDTFRVLVAQESPLDAVLDRNALVKALVQPVIVVLHQIPIVRDVLSPIIGRSEIFTVRIDVEDFVEDGDDPIAFTTDITSVDGTRISVNYFPALDLDTGERAPTVLNGPSLATAGYIDPNQTVTVFGLVPGIKPLREAGYNVVTWDPRGEFASSGILHLDSPYYEAEDVKAIISWVADQDTTAYDDPEDDTDPLIGMVGGSYGGGIQLSTAGVDPRVDAIAPGIAWNNLTETLYPSDAFKTSWATLLLLSLVSQGSRIDGNIYAGILTGVVGGVLLPAQQRWLNANSPDNVVDDIKVPVLFLQGTVDTLFPLQQALNNAQQLPAEAVPVQMVWYCGGHGKCLDPVDANAQTKFLVDRQIDWLDTFLVEDPPATISSPKFTWVDQLGKWHTSTQLPYEAGFSTQTDPFTGVGGKLLLVPVLGGSGPQNLAGFPVSLVSGAEASQAVEVDVPGVPLEGDTQYVVGAPQLSFDYRGVGTSRHVYAQLVDNETGRVVGNIVTPIEVKLDGEHRSVDIPMENIAYTMEPGSSGMTLQIVSSATSYENFTAYGAIEISNVELTLPTTTNVAPLTLEQPDPDEVYVPADQPTLEEILLGRPLF